MFIGCQPIYGVDESIYGHELLYRSNQVDNFNLKQGDQLTIDVMANILVTMEMDDIMGKGMVFINFTGNLLEQRLPYFISSKVLVVEILEDVEEIEGVLAQCFELKENGYLLALDDYVHSIERIRLFMLADIIKVDFRSSTQEEIQSIVALAKEHGKKLLAEKVETKEEFLMAKSMGFHYVQGYYFAKPRVMDKQVLRQVESKCIQLLALTAQEEPDIDAIEQLIVSDAALSYKLLRQINSVYYGIQHEVSSVRHALMLLGVERIGAWAYLLSLRSVDNFDSKESLRLSLLRGKFAQHLARFYPQLGNAQDYYLIGFFSMLDVIFGQSIEVLLSSVPLSRFVKDGLLQQDSVANNVVQLLQAYQDNDWDKVSQLAEVLHLDSDGITKCYLESRREVNQLHRFWF